MNFKYIIYMIRKLADAENIEWGNEALKELLEEIYSQGNQAGRDSEK